MSTRFRKLLSSLFVAFCAASVVVALVPLAFVLFFVISHGLSSVNLEFFTHMPKPVGEPGGGMGNAIIGTLILSGLAATMAIPIGVVSGIYMSEYAGTRFASIVRFAADTLNGVPSIVIGVFAYGVAVLPFKQFSALAGGFALGIMMIPIIARTTEELLLLVPGAMREGALALGATRARAVFTVVLPAALPGVVTGVVLALARIAGETAPLLFTSFNNRFFTTKLTQPIASLTVQVFTYAISPYEDWHRQAWAGALVLVTIVLICSLLARIATHRLERMQALASFLRPRLIPAAGRPGTAKTIRGAVHSAGLNASDQGRSSLLAGIMVRLMLRLVFDPLLCVPGTLTRGNRRCSQTVSPICAPDRSGTLLNAKNINKESAGFKVSRRWLTRQNRRVRVDRGRRADQAPSYCDADVRRQGVSFRS